MINASEGGPQMEIKLYNTASACVVSLYFSFDDDNVM